MMRSFGLFILATGMVLLLSCSPTTMLGLENKVAAKTTVQSGSADTVFINASVYTVNPSNPWAETVAIQNGVIVYVGNVIGAEDWIDNQTEVIDLIQTSAPQYSVECISGFALLNPDGNIKK